MFFRRKKHYYVKKNFSEKRTSDPLKRSQSMRESKFTKRDIHGNPRRAFYILLYMALGFMLFWFLKENWNSIGIFQ